MEQLSALERWRHWNAGGTAMTGCTRAGDFASWWHGIVGGAEKLVEVLR